MHKHLWTIYYQKPLGFMTSHTYEECECGELRDYFENPCGKVMIEKTSKSESEKIKKQKN